MRVSAAKGTTVPLEVTSDVSANDYVVIPRGTTVEGELSDVRHKGSFGRRGFLRVRLDTIAAPDGHLIPAMGSDAVKGTRWSQEENTIMQGLNAIPQAGSYIAIGYWVAAPGQEVGIKEGQTMWAFTLEDVAIDMTKLAPAAGTNAPTLEERLKNGEELPYRVSHLRSTKGGNPGVLKISAAGVSFFSDSEDETAKFTASGIKSVAEEPSLVPCDMPGLSLTPKKGKRYTFLVGEVGHPEPPDDALEALEWLVSTARE